MTIDSTVRATQVSGAQRVRSMLAVASDLWLAESHGSAAADAVLVERHVVVPGGSLLVAAPEGARTGRLLTLTGTDVASVPQRDRVRGRLRLRGTLAPYDGPRSQGVVDHLRGADPDAPTPTLAVLVPTSVELAQGTGAPVWVQVDLDDYRRAAPEPFVGHEAKWLPHLQLDHPGTLRALAERVHGPLSSDVDVRALGLDRFGLTLRLYAGTTSLDLRVDFPAEVSCGCDVREVIRDLLGEGLDLLDR